MIIDTFKNQAEMAVDAVEQICNSESEKKGTHSHRCPELAIRDPVKARKHRRNAVHDICYEKLMEALRGDQESDLGLCSPDEVDIIIDKSVKIDKQCDKRLAENQSSLLLNRAEQSKPTV